MNLFVFFALPLATILLAIVLQRILKSPILVAITFFAVYIIVSFTAFSDNLAEALIATIILTIIAYITAIIVNIIRRICCETLNNINRCNMNNGTEIARRNCSCGDNENSENNNLLTISCRCGDNTQSNDLLTVESKCFSNNMLNENDEVNAISNVQDTVAENIIRNRPVALGNNIVNRNNMRRRFYRR